MSSIWKKIDIIEVRPYLLQDGDECFYARDYIAEGGYKASEANQLISNFKKEVSKRGRPEWRYKVDSITQFANELYSIIPSDFVVAHIPSSKRKADADYDSRLDDVLRELKGFNSTLTIVEPFTVKNTLIKTSYGGERKQSVFYNNLQWQGGLPAGLQSIILVDDVITSGAHFKACKQLLTEKLPQLKVYGVFWAKTVWPENEE